MGKCYIVANAKGGFTGRFQLGFRERVSAFVFTSPAPDTLLVEKLTVMSDPQHGRFLRVGAPLTLLARDADTEDVPEGQRRYRLELSDADRAHLVLTMSMAHAIIFDFRNDHRQLPGEVDGGVEIEAVPDGG